MIKAWPATRQEIVTCRKSWTARGLVSLLFLLMVCTGSRAWSQLNPFDRYEPLKCSGTIPEELRTSSSQKYARDVAQLGDSAKGKAGRARDNFLLQSNFMLDEMLLSGRVIFNDPITEYVSRVKNLILKDHPDLQRELRIYIVKSPVVNAFATNSGVLLVNMGLLAHLRTEAELAFVLCHEIQHYIRKHPINSYVKGEEIKSNARLLNLNTAEDFIAARNRYSRSLELEADELGYALYRTSGYALSAADGVFDMLDRADRPYDELYWDDSFFEWEYLKFPIHYTKWELDPITLVDDDDDTLSTHPNVARRRAAIAAKVANEPEDNGAAFQIGAELFLEARKRCRFELCELYRNQDAFERAIYNAYLLLQEEPESHYLRKVIAESVYALCAYRNKGRFHQVHEPISEVQGEYQQLPYFMESMDREAFTLFAVHEIWKTYLQDLEDQELKVMAEKILGLLFEEHYDAAGWVATQKPDSFPALLTKIQSEKDSAATLRASREAARPSIAGTGTEEAEDEEDSDEGNEEEDSENEDAVAKKDRNAHLQWALTDLFPRPEFAEAWNEQVRAAKEDAEDEENPEDEWSPSTRKLKGARLGIDKVVVVQPLYKSVDRRSKIPVQYLASESSLASYRATMEEMAGRNGVDVEFLENRNLGENDIERFNDVSTMLKWFGNYLDQEDSDVDLINFEQAEAQELVQRYGTPYFVWNAMVTVAEKMPSYKKAYLIIAGISFLPALPFVILKTIKPIKQTLFVTLVFDMEHSKLLMEDYHLLKAKDKTSITRAIIYDKFMQIKQQPK